MKVVRYIDNYNDYFGSVQPEIEKFLHTKSLSIESINQDLWVDPYEGLQKDFIISLNRDLSAAELVDLSADVAEYLNFNIPINITIRFGDHASR